MSEELFANNVPGTRKILRTKCVAIAGCGGLGSNAAVSLVRAGIGRLILADFDRVELANLNRQFFFQIDVGQKKIEALAKYLRAINPDVDLVLHDIRLTPENLIERMGEGDLLIEAFDKAEEKQWLIETWCGRFSEKPVICASGLAGIGDTGSLKVQKAANIYFCGDGRSDRSMGLCSARVAIAANMEANVAIEILVKGQA